MFTYTVLMLALCCYSNVEAFFGCGCAQPPPPPPPCPPPPPPPPPPCPPPPPPCPLPTLCPPLPLCPPPVICPLPPPPPPPPICPPPPPPPPPMCPLPPPPPPPPPPMPCVPPPPPPPPPMPLPQNDCCCQCVNPCQFRSRRRMHGARLFSDALREAHEDPTCNNQKLRAIMEENAATDPSISKRAIQTAAEEQLKERFNVICAKGDFSYVAYTDTYCQVSNEHVTCYAFKPMAA